MRFVYNQPQKCVKKAAAQTLVQRLRFIIFLQDAGADSVCHLKQVLLANKAKLGLVTVRKADCQLGRLQRIAKTRRLDAIVQHLAVRQHKSCCRVPVTPCISTMMMRWLVNTT